MAKKQWISVKRGLIREPKHRLAMGECIWLFSYMLDIADWDTGKVLDWKDESAAEDMQMPIRTLREQRRKLEDLDYISCSQKQYGQEISILNWTNPREYSGEVYNPRKGDTQTSPSKDAQGYTQGYTQGSSQDVTPTFNPKNQTSIATSPKTDEVQGGYSTAYHRGEQERPDKVTEWLRMADMPGLKEQAKLDALLSAYGEAFTVNTETAEWKKLAKHALSEQKLYGHEPKVFIEWVKRQDGYPKFWSAKRMLTEYPRAYIVNNDTEEKLRLL